MRGFKEPGFADRQKAAQQARQGILQKFKAQPGPDDPEVVKRRQEREAAAARREQQRLEREAAKAEQKRLEEEAKPPRPPGSPARRKKLPLAWPRWRPSRRPSAMRVMPRARHVARGSDCPRASRPRDDLDDRAMTS